MITSKGAVGAFGVRENSLSGAHRLLKSPVVSVSSVNLANFTFVIVYVPIN